MYKRQAEQTEGGGVASLAPALTLAFEVQPTQVTLRRWPAEYVGRTQEGEDQAETCLLYTSRCV